MIELAWKPDWLWLALGSVVATALLGWSYWCARGSAHRAWRVFFTGLRLLALATVVVCLLDPQWIKEIKHYPSSRVALLLDTSRSMNWKEDEQTRLAQAKQWIREELKLPIGVSLSTYGFSSNLVALPDVQSVEANGNRTSIAESLNNLSQATAHDPPDSVIVLSDGGDNSLRNIETVARTFGEKRIPIHTVALGSTNEPPDVIIENVQVKRALPHQTTARAVVSLRGPGFEGLVVPLRIQKDGRILGEVNVKLTGKSQRVDVEFTPPTSGFQSFTAAVRGQNGERRLENNYREFGLTVQDEVLRVLYMEASGFGQNAFQPIFLKHALEDIPGIEIKTLYCEQYGSPRASVSLQPAYTDPKNGVPIYRVRHPIEGYPKTLEELLKYHVVICSDIPREEFTQEQLENTEKFVTQYGGGFVMVGGHTSFGSGNYQHTIINNLIPVSMEVENTTMDTSFTPRLTPNALEHPIMQLSANKAFNELIWTKKFPELRGFNRVDRAKPGAVVLLEHPAMRTRYGPNIVLAVEDVGKGRTMAFTSDTTSDWGTFFETIWGEKINPAQPLSENNCDSRYYRQFWVNSVRWLAAHKFTMENNLVTLELENTCYLPGTEVPVLVHALDRQGKEIRDANVSLTLSGAGDETPPIRALFDERSHAYVGTVKVPLAAQFLLNAKAQFKDGKTGEDHQVLVGEETDTEMADIRARPATMAALSRGSGGKVLDPHSSAEIITAALGTVKPPTTEYQRTSLWDKSWLLAGLIGLLTFEWILRRWRGMA